MGSDSGRRLQPRRSLGGVELLCYRASVGSGPQPRRNIAGEILDISPGGARLRLIEPMDKGETLTVELKDRRSGESFRARGEIRWCASEGSAAGGRHFVGLQFQEVYTPVGRREKFTVGPRLASEERDGPDAFLEKRAAPRFGVEDYVVTCLPRGPLSPEGLRRNLARELVDLSRKGVRLKVAERLKPGACYVLTLHMNRFSDGLKATAEVRWCRPEAPPAAAGFLAGLQFLDLPDERVKMIDFLRGWFAKKGQRPEAGN